MKDIGKILKYARENKNIHKTSNGINRHPQEIAFWLREQRCRAKSINLCDSCQTLWYFCR